MNNNMIKFLQLNVRSIRPEAKRETLTQYLHDNEIKVAALQETWTKDPVMYKIKDYDMIIHSRDLGDGGGVGLVIHKTLVYKVIDTPNFEPIELVAAEIMNLGTP